MTYDRAFFTPFKPFETWQQHLIKGPTTVSSDGNVQRTIAGVEAVFRSSPAHHKLTSHSDHGRHFAYICILILIGSNAIYNSTNPPRHVFGMHIECLDSDE